MSPTDEINETPASESRRWLLAGVVGVAAAGVGAGMAWQRFQPHDREPENFWGLSFPVPEEGGQSLSLASLRGRPLLVNFWATWCPPCVEELPLLNRFYRENKANGWQIVALAVDKAESVRRFLARSPLDFPVGMAGMEGTELARSLGNEAGGLPYTVVFGRDGRVTERKIGQLQDADLQSWRARI